MAKRKQQEEPQGPGISGLFNVPPTYFLPGTIGDVGAVAIDYPTMRAEPWNQTAAPIPTPSSPQGEILAAPPGADAPQFATGQQWKDLYDLMATETDVYRKYLKDTHDIGGEYFPMIVAANQMDPRLQTEASGWYDPRQQKVFIPLTQGGYESGEYMDVGPTVQQTPSGASQQFVPVVTSARNPKMSIRMDMSPIPHEIGHYYDYTGGPADDIDTMSWGYYNQPGVSPWDYIFRNMTGTIRPEQATGDEQSWFMSGGAPPAGINVPAEMYAEFFRKALQAGVGLDQSRLSELYGGKSPVSMQSGEAPRKQPRLTPQQSARRKSEEATALESAGNEADILNQAIRGMPNASSTESWPYVFDAVTELAQNAPSPATQQAMQPALTEEAKNFLYWLFTRGYNPR